MSKYRIGDRIRNIDTGWIGTVVGVSYGRPWSTLVAYDENDESKVITNTTSEKKILSL